MQEARGLIPFNDFDKLLGKKEAGKEKTKDVTLAADLNLHEEITCGEALKLVEQAKRGSSEYE